MHKPGPIDVFSQEGKAALAMFCQQKPLLAFDFDGTLAAIVSDPTAAQLSTSTWAFLERLQNLYCLAVLTGRKKADVSGRIPSSIRHVVGNHGIELDFDANLAEGKVQAMRTTEEWVLQLAESLKNAPHRLDVENKLFSLTVHFGRATHPESAREYAREVLHKLVPKARLMDGKDVINVIPVGLPHKGEALALLMKHQGFHCSLFCGDDVTDEDAFREAGPEIFTVKVGTEPTSARYFIASQRDMDAFLALLIELAQSGQNTP